MNVDLYEYNSNNVIFQSKTYDISMLIDGKVRSELLHTRITKPGLDPFWSPGVDPYKSIFKFAPERPFPPPSLDMSYIDESFIDTAFFKNIELESGEFKEEDYEFFKIF
ncbi:hypothetical protein [Oceanirhabdus sp. W0125-5]|uniref:hypothetical protein n=1 Tax=Oceanirhabdus sp. W0125-5 TaxID=2999116 RepID=UPI0022F30BBD|nr:hypothetical protein [Oceanirhabdus sp. W0125-5]WBW99215.1 hypothetical protein OW730_10835 [Oceanirhabdus sp. W0125-5]